jgi:hypothetical protein
MISPVYNRLANWRNPDDRTITSEERLLLKKRYVVEAVIS